ncbi:MAG: hypothetical protein HOB49_03925, partial [Gemmatimonadetes bacterium]|nr:hypothetical protein [Gemmatimonadota bacterium]
MEKDLKDIVPIVITPFDDELKLDEVSLQRHVEFCVACGGKGLVGPA